MIDNDEIVHIKNTMSIAIKCDDRHISQPRAIIAQYLSRSVQIPVVRNIAGIDDRKSKYNFVL